MTERDTPEEAAAPMALTRRLFVRVTETSTGIRRWAKHRAGSLRAPRIDARRGTVILLLSAAAIWAATPLAVDAALWLWSRPNAARVLILAGVVLTAAIAFTRRLRDKRPAQPHLGALIALAWCAVAAMVAVLTGGAWWIMGAPTARFPSELPPASLDAIATRAFAIVAGLGGAALLVISYRRQRTTEADGARADLAVAREDTRLFTERFTSASEQLGSEHPAVRLAGVHALAHLADDAPEGREELVQMVIDVLCAYLRMPYRTAPEIPPEGADAQQAEEHHLQLLEFKSLREVRHTIIRIIGDRLRQPTRWRGKDYDFTGVVFDGGDLDRAHFTGGRTSFCNAWFAGGYVRFSRAEFTGAEVDFSEAKFLSGEVSFRAARFADGDVEFSGAQFVGGEVDFRGAMFVGGDLGFVSTRFAAGKVDFSLADFTSGRISFSKALFAGGNVSFRGAEFSGGQVDFSSARFAHKIDFSRTRFTGGEADFSGAEFSSEEIDFTRTVFSDGAVSFAIPAGGKRDARGVCPRGLLEAHKAGLTDVVTLPPAWDLSG
ncbi:hypothetical protein GCM10023224_26960 [Streptomonospora halophila]|uniref:Pentapeptide repeat-containing protein n=1 Tax=Streptomonospora halophila TaxID=427369 RepID=A0ABP9GQC6_9ACTN